MLPKLTTENGLTKVELPNGEIYWFSYRTCIGYQNRDGERFVRENIWGNTTARHLHAIEKGDKDDRLNVCEFEMLFEGE